MPQIKLFQLATPTSATQVTSTKTPCRQVAISNSGANASAYGDSTLGAASTGIGIPSGQIGYLGHCSGSVSFDLSELYVIAATGNVNVLAVLF